MFDGLREVGEIVRIQLQPAKIKAGIYPDESYLPERLVALDSLMLEERGVAGMTPEGQRLLDVHHADHPQSRFRGGNGLSVGFTAHYRQMQNRFGEHLYLGCGAENLLVESERIWRVDELAPYVLIHRRGQDGWLVLGPAMVAAPCLPFARYASRAQLDARATKLALRFLNDGMRGFYFQPEMLPAEARVSVGDQLFVADELPPL